MKKEPMPKYTKDLWKCKSCGCMFVKFAKYPNGYDPNEGVERCSGCLVNEIVGRRLDDLDSHLAELFALPNWQNRCGPWKDIKEALNKLHKTFTGYIHRPKP